MGYTQLRLLLGLLIVLTVRETGSAQDNGSKEGIIWEGVYSSAQTDRAKTPFTAVCRRCHNDDLGGSERGPALRGERFMLNWETQGLNRLFARIKDTMPPDSPTSLPDEDYLDLVTLILQANGFPAGAQSLSADTLESVMIMRRAGESPQVVPNFRMVQVVGCLALGPDNAWLLTRTTEPAVANDQPSSEATLRDAAAQPLGSLTFRLLSAKSFNPERHSGHKMKAKGLVYREPGKDRINVVTLEMVGPSCAS